MPAPGGPIESLVPGRAKWTQTGCFTATPRHDQFEAGHPALRRQGEVGIRDAKIPRQDHGTVFHGVFPSISTGRGGPDDLRRGESHGCGQVPQPSLKIGGGRSAGVNAVKDAEHHSKC